ncbi:uncharacterized protein LOC120292633 [Eucalyptus grandis]|uniref:uncharacterized protein LOC120292633 n=1 Tax=Eucalyptus grandis TaxID=71139 RepID=UPI00192EDD23|nr:uncharacterized protein LOC120292633 [Eucalyptus grandis]
MRYEEIKLSIHRHYLKPEDSKVLFRCDGCKQDGIGLSYRCDKCNFDLHFHCAKTPNTISHPSYGKRSFKFMSEPPKGRPPCCDACGNDVTGFFYCCEAKGVKVNLHPCCAKLPKELDHGKMKFSLWLQVTTSCHKCEKERKSWVYRSECDKKYTLHVACAREMLMEWWRNGDGGTSTGLPTGVPCLKDRLQVPHKMSKSKKKWWKMLLLALRFMISAWAGDPTTLIAGVLSSIMS